jgi:hypothetical protein
VREQISEPMETPSDTLLAELGRLCGDRSVITDDAERVFFAHDVYAAGSTPMAVFRPDTVEALAKGVALLAEAGVALFPRGGGMSYTDGFLADTNRSVAIDTRGLNRIVTVNETDLWATVEAGVTWAQLDADLAPRGLRARFWGPMSGLTATIGGGMSHGAATFGSAKVGGSGNAALGFDIVLPDGRMLKTGMDAQPAHDPFFRNYGPDLTGLFAHDGGAFGIKARISLALEARPALVDGVSVAFPDFATMLEAVRKVSRDGLASEVIVTDAALMAMNAGAVTFSASLAMAWRVMASARNPLIGLSRVVRMALAGKRFFGKAAFGAHFVVEAPDAARLRLGLEDVRRALGASAVEMANTMPIALRAHPFPPLPVTAADGRRLLALHGLVPFSRAQQLEQKVKAALARHEQALAAANITIMFVFATVGTNSLLYEPFFYWKDSHTAFHTRRLGEALGSQPQSYPDNPEARALIETIKSELVNIFYTCGCAHLQIGRVYPLMRDRDQAATELLLALRKQLDPDRRMNPGVLGL